VDKNPRDPPDITTQAGALHEDVRVVAAEWSDHPTFREEWEWCATPRLGEV
jgi:hypothetical protein